MAYLSWAVVIVPVLWFVYFIQFVLEPILKDGGFERETSFWGLKDVVNDYKKCCDVLEGRGDENQLRSLRLQAKVLIGVLFMSVALRLVI